MSFIAQCCFCKHQVRAPARALGASVECPKCKNLFTVAPMEDAIAPQAVTRFRSRPRGAAEDRTDAAVAAGPPPLPTSTEEAPDLGDRFGDGPTSAPSAPPLAPWLRHVHPVGLAAVVLGSVALAFASLPGFSGFTRPLAAAGLAVGLIAVAMCARSDRPRYLFPIAGSAMSLIVLGLALCFPGALGPVYEASRQGRQEDPQAVQIIPLRSHLRPSDVSTEGWADATQAVIQQGHVRVQIAAAAVGPVRLRAAKATFTKEKYLAIQLRIVHVGSAREIEFQHWGHPNSDRAKEPPSLSDVAGQSYAWQALDPSQAVVGQTPRASLHPGQFTDDLLLFEAPSADVELRLQLPAAAWGGAGTVRFLIPAGMIKRGPEPRKK